MAGCVAGWSRGLAGGLGSWLGVCWAGWLAEDPKLDHGIRAIQFSEMDDPISVPIFRSNFPGDTSAAKRSNKLDQEIGSRIGSCFGGSDCDPILRSNFTIQFYDPNLRSNFTIQIYDPFLRSNFTIQFYDPFVRSIFTVHFYDPILRSKFLIQLFDPISRPASRPACPTASQLETFRGKGGFLKAPNIAQASVLETWEALNTAQACVLATWSRPFSSRVAKVVFKILFEDTLKGFRGALGVTLVNFGTHWSHFGSLWGILERPWADLS